MPSEVILCSHVILVPNVNAIKTVGRTQDHRTNEAEVSRATSGRTEIVTLVTQCWQVLHFNLRAKFIEVLIVSPFAFFFLTQSLAV